MLDARRVIELLGLEPHPEEGGFFRETYRSTGRLDAGALATEPGFATAVAAGLDGPRSHSTAIFYLLTPETFSELHRLRADEVYHFYLGDAVEQLRLLPDGSGRRLLLGSDLEAGQRLQDVVPAGVWQGSRLAPGGRHGWALLGATMAPGFDYADYDAAGRAELAALYPAFAELIAKLTRRP